MFRVRPVSRLAAPVAGTILVSLLTACGSSSPTAPATPAFAVTAISPTAGPIAGGTTVTISGGSFIGSATVTLGGSPATDIVVTSNTSLTAVTPAHGAGPVSVVVSSGGQTATLANGFTFVAPTGTNQAPVIESLTAQGSAYANEPPSFADLGQSLTLAATVTDNETAPSALIYQWSAPTGTISGSGETVTWTAPSSALTPSTVVVSLTVIEHYTENGVAQTNTTSGSVPIGLHDSQSEISALGEDFLVLFSQSQYTTDQVMHGFSNSCYDPTGRDDEYGDVANNRLNYVELPGYSVTPKPPVQIAFNSGFTELFPVSDQGPRLRQADGLSSFAAQWIVRHTAADPPEGQVDESTGVDYVTAQLQNDRWYLCASDWDGVTTILSTPGPLAMRLFTRPR